MTISFSCDCGALFEVSEDMAGLVGRCRKCCREMTIPSASADEPPHPVNEPEPVQQAEEARFQASAEGRFCPFCGKPTPPATDTCPSCLKLLRATPPRLIDASQLSIPEWILVSVFAPFGLLAGLLCLVMGQRKGLTMIAFSTACLVFWWLALATVSWIG